MGALFPLRGHILPATECAVPGVLTNLMGGRAHILKSKCLTLHSVSAHNDKYNTPVGGISG